VDPLSLLQSGFMGGGGGGGIGSILAAAKPNSQASGAPAVSGATLNDSNWTVNIGSSGGGMSVAAAGATNWLMLAAIAAGLIWLIKKH
jgi:hypothetical protein